MIQLSFSVTLEDDDKQNGFKGQSCSEKGRPQYIY
jgi:hypothetical protein